MPRPSPPCARGRGAPGASARSGSVPGRTPWPRLKTWPGRPPARASTSSASRSTTSHGAPSAAGSRFPWTARPGTADQPSSSGTRQSSPMTSPPAAAMSAQQVGRAGAEVDRRHVDRGQDRARSTARRGRGRAPARACPPTSRRAGRRPRRRAPWPRGRRRTTSASFAISASQVSGSESISAFVRGKLAARPPLDEVAGDRERAAAEADHRPVGVELAANEPHRLEHRRERLVRVGHPQALDVGRARDRPVDDRPDALDELDVDPHPDDRGHDVGEHHGRVDAVAANRLQRHLGAELRRVRDLEEPVALADRAVLGQRAPGLAHEPHGRALDGFATRGTDEERGGHHGSVAPATT